MMFRMLLVLAAAAMLTFAGCAKKSEPQEPVEPTEVQVTEESLDSELDKMEADIDADIAAEE